MVIVLTSKIKFCSTAMALPKELGNVSVFLHEPSQFFASGSQGAQTSTLAAVKYLFDLSIESENTSRPHIVALLSSLQPSHAPQTRSQARANAASPRPPPVSKGIWNPTPLTSLFIDGLDEDQVWAQLDLRTKPVCDMLENVLEGDPAEDDVSEDGEQAERLRDALAALGEDPEADMDQFFDDIESDDSSLSENFAEESGDETEDSVEGGEEDFNEEGVMTLRGPSSDEESEDESLNSRRRPAHPKQGKSVLDDGFFDLSAFNAETEQAEARSASKGRLADEDDSDDDASVDLFAPIAQGSNFEEDDLENDPGEAFYGDFFEAPRKSVSRVKKVPSQAKISNGPGGVRFHQEVRVRTIKPSGKNKSLYEDDEDDEDEDDEFPVSNTLDVEMAENDDMELDLEDESQDSDEESRDETRNSGHRETIERLKDDLFAEEEDDALLEDLTAHEQRMAALRQEIAELESENVTKKSWTLMGEAGSRARPQNSLLEEDLEFDRVMKAVPIITEEIVQSLEETIKARILENRFDDVVRLRPLEDKPFLPSRLLELQDTKSTQSLAQIYENDYIDSAGAEAADDRDGKLKKEHDAIEALWEKICGKLDALCNAHFTPKQPKAVISAIANVSTTTLESALPTTKSSATMLAPEEVFLPSSSEPRARSELTPTEKRSLRGKERKMKKKQRDALNTSVDKFARAKSIGGVKRQKRAALESVVKRGKGVTVVGKQKKDSTKKHDRKRT